jgi:uncharacterized surface protein with fasciclin (FAS1) repeats
MMMFVSVSRTKYTVFAPSNDAFAKLDQAIIDRIHASESYVRGERLAQSVTSL